MDALKLAATIRNKFPKMPEGDVNQCVARATEPGAVGTLDTANTAFLAVKAYIRHTLTDYDTSLRRSRDKYAERRRIYETVRAKMIEWGCKKPRMS